MFSANSFGKFRGMLMGCVLALWLLWCGTYVPRIASIGLRTGTFAGLLAAFGMACFFIFFWLHGAYHLVLSVANLKTRRRKAIRAHGQVASSGGTPTAILYTTMNDFDEVAARSCLSQTYKQFQVFILDDSSDRTVRALIDDFQRANPGKCTVIRRNSRAGNKAGNLNHALRGPARAFPIFVLVDADCLLPPDYVERLIPKLEDDPLAAFVQSACKARPEHDRLTRHLSLSVDRMWEDYMAYREKSGFVPLMGRGAAVRHEVWEKVGGFPEIIAEDVGFALAARAEGFLGKYVPEPFCLESLPPDIRAFGAQQGKYSAGAFQFLFQFWKQILFCKEMPWYEKVDLAILLSNNMLPSAFFIFLLFFGFAISAVYFNLRLIGVPIGNHSIACLPLLQPDSSLISILSWDFSLASLVCVVAPNIGVVTLARSTWQNRVRFLAWSTLLHLAILPRVTLNTLRQIFTGRWTSSVTGDRTPSDTHRMNRWDLTMGVLLLTCAIFTLNFYIGAVSVAILIGTRLAQSPQKRVPAAFVSLPLGLMLIALARLGFGLMTVQAAGAVAFPFGF
jgi:cellulose synthase/poly-beta-1,6-N-acetylglucosamine synthase-like glycosyltransferase